jgi:predicted dehydrogenase
MSEQEARGTANPLRVAIIGYGLAGSTFHAPLVDSTPGMEVAAIVTTDSGRRQQAREDFPETALLDSPEEIFNNAGRYDLVAVAALNTAHAPLATAALKSGLPTVVDKPMATSTQEAHALVETSEQTGVPLTVFQNRRWDGDFLTLRRLLNENTVGPITRFESRFERYRPTVRVDAWREQTPLAQAGGLLWDLGAHLIDQALVLFGRPARVYAEMPLRRQGAVVDDDSFVALTFASGVTAHLWMSVTARILGPRFRLHGLRGSYEKFGLDPQEDQLKAGRRPGDDGWGREPQRSWGWLLTDVAGVAVDATAETLPGAYERFYAGVRDALTGTGKPMPVDPRDAVKTLGVIEAAIQSAQSDTVVSLL